MPTYKLNFWFEWLADTCFQAADVVTSEKFGIGMIAPERLPLKQETITQVKLLSQWHDTSLNWDYPPNPGLWRQEECNRFNAAAKQLFDTITVELGETFEIAYSQIDLVEDPELDKYLNDPQNFKRDVTS